jgi:hypothetical protein
MACDKDRFEEWCKPQFEELKTLLADFKTAMCGDTEKPGIAERVRRLEGWQKAIMGVLSAVGIWAIVNVGEWVKGFFIK